jgi:hypothetical protein
MMKEVRATSSAGANGSDRRDRRAARIAEPLIKEVAMPEEPLAHRGGRSMSRIPAKRRVKWVSSLRTSLDLRSEVRYLMISKRTQ